MNTAPLTLAEALRYEFTNTELHAFIADAERSENLDAPHWKRLRAAAVEAANCSDCRSRRPAAKVGA